MDFNSRNTSNRKTQLKGKKFNYKMNEKFEQTLHKEGEQQKQTSDPQPQSDKSKSSPQRDTTTSVCPGLGRTRQYQKVAQRCSNIAGRNAKIVLPLWKALK